MNILKEFFVKALISISLSFVVSTVFSCADDSVAKEISNEIPLQVKYDVEFYDIYLEIDTRNDIFRSNQSIEITPLQRAKIVIFDIHSDLDITNLYLSDMMGSSIPFENWEYLYDIISNRGNEIEKFSRYKIMLRSEIEKGTSMKLMVELSINISKVGNGTDNELLKFSVSSKGSRALHPVSGFLPFFGGTVSAPFRFEISYPNEDVCSIPGNKVSRNIDGDHVNEIFESIEPRIPVFYVGPGEEVKRTKDGISISYLLTKGQLFDEEVADKTFEIDQLFYENFGNPGTSEYRITFVPLNSSSITGESKGNAIYFAYKNPDDFNWDYNSKVNFINLVSHELFHNWNLWNAPWQGSFYEWFVEGGAGFISAWACETELGSDAGRSVRKDFVEGYIRNKAYNASLTLENAQKSGAAERSLIYSYGALVWEQLRNKIGDEAFFSGLSDFYSNSKSKINNYNSLVGDLQTHTNFSVNEYLNKWVKQNAKIDLRIDNVQINQRNNIFEVDVDFYLYSETNVEIFTAIGFKASINGEETSIPIQLNAEGKHRISFTSELRPKFIRLDPNFIVPQMDLTNDSWSS